MTDEASKAKWEALAHCVAPIESCLHKNITEHLNSEVVLKSVTTIEQAKEWLQHSFFRIRLAKNPSHYDVDSETVCDPSELLNAILGRQLELLSTEGILSRSREPGSMSTLEATSAGAILSRYSVSVKTFKNFSGLEEGADLQSVLQMLSGASEFETVRLRAAEKGVSCYLSSNKQGCSLIHKAALYRHRSQI